MLLHRNLLRLPNFMATSIAHSEVRSCVISKTNISVSFHVVIALDFKKSLISINKKMFGVDKHFSRREKITDLKRSTVYFIIKKIKKIKIERVVIKK